MQIVNDMWVQDVTQAFFAFDTMRYYYLETDVKADVVASVND